MFFVFSRLSKELLTALKTKNPFPQGNGFLLVTPRVEKSNFYKDIEKVIEWEFQSKPKSSEKK
jgi:hypothetical protein